MEAMVIDKSFWNGKKVFLTGHTGFKGSWLSIWLLNMGANIVGYSVGIPTDPSLFVETKLEEEVAHIVGDVRDYEFLKKSLKKSNPDIVIHMAAQPLVRFSYKNPRYTYETNVMGTVNILDAIRDISKIRAAVIVTTDKCYENREWVYGYRENEPMGGYDPYSSSKGAAELVVSAYNQSFFKNGQSNKVICSARAGNVIGGGDWAEDRLVPDLIKGISSNKKTKIRNPQAIRPWQHVLEPLSGYLLLAQKGYENDNSIYGAWNFGPREEAAKNVKWVANKIAEVWGKDSIWEMDDSNHPHEAAYLKLDISKARQKLNWRPKWSVEEAIFKTTQWYKNYYTNKLTPDALFKLCAKNIESYNSQI